MSSDLDCENPHEHCKSCIHKSKLESLANVEYMTVVLDYFSSEIDEILKVYKKLDKIIPILEKIGDKTSMRRFQETYDRLKIKLNNGREYSLTDADIKMLQGTLLVQGKDIKAILKVFNKLDRVIKRLDKLQGLSQVLSLEMVKQILKKRLQRLYEGLLKS